MKLEKKKTGFGFCSASTIRHTQGMYAFLSFGHASGKECSGAVGRARDLTQNHPEKKNTVPESPLLLVLLLLVQ